MGILDNEVTLRVFEFFRADWMQNDLYAVAFLRLITFVIVYSVWMIGLEIYAKGSHNSAKEAMKGMTSKIALIISLFTLFIPTEVLIAQAPWAATILSSVVPLAFIFFIGFLVWQATSGIQSQRSKYFIRGFGLFVIFVILMLLRSNLASAFNIGNLITGAAIVESEEVINSLISGIDIMLVGIFFLWLYTSFQTISGGSGFHFPGFGGGLNTVKLPGEKGSGTTRVIKTVPKEVKKALEDMNEHRKKLEDLSEEAIELARKSEEEKNELLEEARKAASDAEEALAISNEARNNSLENAEKIQRTRNTLAELARKFNNDIKDLKRDFEDILRTVSSMEETINEELELLDSNRALGEEILRDLELKVRILEGQVRRLEERIEREREESQHEDEQLSQELLRIRSIIQSTQHEQESLRRGIERNDSKISLVQELQERMNEELRELKQEQEELKKLKQELSDAIKNNETQRIQELRVIIIQIEQKISVNIKKISKRVLEVTEYIKSSMIEEAEWEEVVNKIEGEQVPLLKAVEKEQKVYAKKTRKYNKAHLKWASKREEKKRAISKKIKAFQMAAGHAVNSGKFNRVKEFVDKLPDAKLKLIDLINHEKEHYNRLLQAPYANELKLAIYNHHAVLSQFQDDLNVLDQAENEMQKELKTEAENAKKSKAKPEISQSVREKGELMRKASNDMQTKLSKLVNLQQIVSGLIGEGREIETGNHNAIMKLEKAS